MQFTTDSDMSGAELIITLKHKQLSVSSLSTLLRVVQATLRQIAMEDPKTRSLFDKSHTPALIVSPSVSGDAVSLRFTFADPSTNATMDDLSRDAFQAFITAFVWCLKSQPQRGLWGIPPKVPQRRRLSKLEARVDQVRVELRRLSSASVIYGNHSISIEGDRIEIGGANVP